MQRGPVCALHRGCRAASAWPQHAVQGTQRRPSRPRSKRMNHAYVTSQRDHCPATADEIKWAAFGCHRRDPAHKALRTLPSITATQLLVVPAEGQRHAVRQEGSAHASGRDPGPSGRKTEEPQPAPTTWPPSHPPRSMPITSFPASREAVELRQGTVGGERGARGLDPNSVSACHAVRPGRTAPQEAGVMGEGLHGGHRTLIGLGHGVPMALGHSRPSSTHLARHQTPPQQRTGPPQQHRTPMQARQRTTAATTAVDPSREPQKPPLAGCCVRAAAGCPGSQRSCQGLRIAN